jgi:hypothetical protein
VRALVNNNNAQEFDYRLECRNAKAIRDNLKKGGFDDRIIVPEVFEDLCTKKLLVMEEVYVTLRFIYFVFRFVSRGQQCGTLLTYRGGGGVCCRVVPLLATLFSHSTLLAVWRTDEKYALALERGTRLKGPTNAWYLTHVVLVGTRPSRCTTRWTRRPPPWPSRRASPRSSS